MIVIINGIRNGVDWNNFSFSASQPEDAFDKISTYVATGLVLLKVCLVEENGHREVPVDVFDGQPFGLPIQQLQQQWENVLQKRPAPVLTIHSTRLKMWNGQLITYYEKQMDLFRIAIERMEKAAQKNETSRTSARRNRINNQQASLLQRQHRQLAVIRVSHQKAVDYSRKLSL